MANFQEQAFNIFSYGPKCTINSLVVVNFINEFIETHMETAKHVAKDRELAENDFVKDRNYEGLVDCQFNQIKETLLDIKKVVDKSRNGFVHFSDIRKWIDSAKQFHLRFRGGVDIPDIAATFPKIFMASRALAELDARFNCVTAGVQQMLPNGPPAGFEGYFRNGKGELKFQHLKVTHQAPQPHQGLIAPPLEDPTEKLSLIHI